MHSYVLNKKTGASCDPLAENPLKGPLLPHVDTHDIVKRGLKFEFLK